MCPSKVSVSPARDASFHFSFFSDFAKFAFRLRETRLCRFRFRPPCSTTTPVLSVSPTPNGNFAFWTLFFIFFKSSSDFQNFASRLRQMTTLVATPIRHGQQQKQQKCCFVYAKRSFLMFFRCFFFLLDFYEFASRRSEMNTFG